MEIKVRGNLRGCVDLSGANRDKRHFVCECVSVCVCAFVHTELHKQKLDSGKVSQVPSPRKYCTLTASDMQMKTSADARHSRVAQICLFR